MKIGLTCREEIIDGIKKIYVNGSYLNLLDKYDLIPIFLINQNFDEMVSLCDAFMILGGYDLSPNLYKQNNTTCYKVNEELDNLDYRVLSYCVNHIVPCLGICRGLQVINVYFNGSLFQDVNICHLKSDNSTVMIVNQSRFFNFNNDKYLINSYHHQGIDKVGNDLVVLGVSDGLVEMVEHISLPIIGVQWHIEKIDNQFNNYLFQVFLSLIK